MRFRTWGDLNARARGLATHLLPRPRLDAATRTTDLPAFRQALDGTPYTPALAGAGRDAAVFDRALRATASARLALLARWAGPRIEALAVVYLAVDRRSLKALLRGAAAGLAPATRLEAALATPALPAPLLRDLAGAESPEEVVRALDGRGHPLVAGLDSDALGVPTDLLGLETAIDRRWAERAAAGARGDAVLRELVGYALDLENMFTLMALQRPGELDPATLFLPGGRTLRRESFLELAALDDPDALRRSLAETFAGTHIGQLLKAPPAPTAVERLSLGLALRLVRDRSRLDPLSSGPTLLCLLACIAELRELRERLWAIAMGAAAARRAP